ncbi:MAG TPA: hypothetical protein VLK79_15595 [Gaiellales bacterium]|nr:hypothetical protein [Gaiellales bacterium]
MMTGLPSCAWVVASCGGWTWSSGHAAVTWPEQSYASGPAAAKLYGLLSWASAKLTTIRSASAAMIGIV